jgi:threonine dehydrogenase-like Zn-dependent dehydrogenase
VQRIRPNPDLLRRIEEGEIDPSFVITHRACASKTAPQMYKTFLDKEDRCIKVVTSPN